jgi:rhodanese-related sulfurtransferase
MSNSVSISMRFVQTIYGSLTFGLAFAALGQVSGPALKTGCAATSEPPVLIATAQPQSPRRAEESNAAAKSESAVSSTTSPFASQCNVDYVQWSAFVGSQAREAQSSAAVIDVRNRARQAARGLIGFKSVVSLPLDQLVTLQFAKNRPILIVPDIAAHETALAVCSQLRTQGNGQAFVLQGGERGWFAQHQGATDAGLARVDLATVLSWDLSKNVEMLETTLASAQSVLARPLASGASKRILLINDISPNRSIVDINNALNAIPLHTWWSSASAADLNDARAQTVRIATAANTPRNRPCGFL